MQSIKHSAAVFFGGDIQAQQREQQRARQAMFSQNVGEGVAQVCQQQQTAHGSTPAVFTDTIYSVSATQPSAFTQGGFTASGMDYSVIGGIESFPTVGSKRGSSVFSPIRGAKTKVKGTSDYQGGDIVMADLPLDAGQIILKAIEASATLQASIKAEFSDGEVHYYFGHILSWTLSQAQEAAFMKRTAEFQLNQAPVIVAAP